MGDERSCDRAGGDAADPHVRRERLPVFIDHHFVPELHEHLPDADHQLYFGSPSWTVGAAHPVPVLYDAFHRRRRMWSGLFADARQVAFQSDWRGNQAEHGLSHLLRRFLGVAGLRHDAVKRLVRSVGERCRSKGDAWAFLWTVPRDQPSGRYAVQFLSAETGGGALFLYFHRRRFVLRCRSVFAVLESSRRRIPAGRYASRKRAWRHLQAVSDVF